MADISMIILNKVIALQEKKCNKKD